MPRPKGSKNKVKSTIAQLDFTSLIAEKSSTKEALVADIATLEENLTSIREELKVKKSELKTVEKELCKLEEQRAAFDARERKKKCEEFSANLSTLAGQPTKEQEDTLWSMLLYLQGCVFPTAKALKFTYKIKGGEMFVNRKSKSITQATVFMAFRKAMELGGAVSGPKKLGTFGASYLYPIFVRLGVIRGDAG